MISFYLHTKKDKPNGFIRMRINYGNYIVENNVKKYKPFEMRLPKIVVKIRFWNPKKSRLKIDYSYPEASQINAFLDKINAKMLDFIADCNFNAIRITDYLLKDKLNEIYGTKTKLKVRLFSDFLDEFIGASEKGIRLTAQGEFIRPATIRKYKVALQHFSSFENYINRQIPISEVDKVLAVALLSYFNEKNMAQNTKATQFNVYRTAINYAIEKGEIKSSDFKDVTAPEVLTDALALSEFEVERIMRLDLKDSILDLHRDVFIVGIFTLLRFADYSAIDSVNIDIKERIINIIPQKTLKPVHLPLHKHVVAIFKKYGNKIPHIKHVQTFNRSLKEIARLANITQVIEIRQFKGGKTTKKKVQKCDLIASHTARRTGATLLYLAGVPKKVIMQLTGHTKDENFDRYIRIDAYQSAKLLTKHKFYTD